ncbi:MAG: helix-turn-helix transcriptional regulator [Phyllobacteriaceae bacterium]|nr:helix-turn-helix transcriptional regulator [Phyllobacteriaceae bacterium]
MAQGFAVDRRFLQAVSAIQVFCGTAFTIDIVYESHIEFFNQRPLSPVEAIHLGVETLAVILLFYGFYASQRQLRRLCSKGEEKARLLAGLRGHFDEIIDERFADWGLSAAERDIALLSLRGLSIGEIARLRDTRDGTVKAQLSAVYRKSGVAGRPELLALFMDEFLDYGAGDETTQQQPGARRAFRPGLAVAPSD